MLQGFGFRVEGLGLRVHKVVPTMRVQLPTPPNVGKNIAQSSLKSDEEAIVLDTFRLQVPTRM